jgi:type IV secretion system protein VirD4
MNESEFIRKKPTQSAYFAHSTHSFFSFYVVPGVIMALAMFASTYTFARLVGDVSLLGNPLFFYHGEPVYAPWMIIAWIIKFNMFSSNYDLFKDNMLEALMWGVYGTATTMVYLLLFTFLRGKSIRQKNLHGTARWGNNKDLKRNGLVSPSGFIFGQRKKAKIKIKSKIDKISMKTRKTDKLIAYRGDNSSMVVMPPRSGKGVSVVIPTLLSHLGSVIVMDLKEELWKTTAGYRSSFSNVLKLSLTSSNSLGINPLMLIRESTSWRDAHMCASILLAPQENETTSATANHFRESAIDALTGFILHVLCSNYADKSLGGVLDFIGSSGYVGDKLHEGENASEVIASAFDSLLIEMQNSTHVSHEVHSHIIGVTSRLLTKEYEEKSGVISTCNRALLLFQDPVIRQNTSRHEIDFKMFIDNELPVSLYLTTPYSDLQRVSPILRLILSMSISYFSEGSTMYGEEKLNHKLLYLLDEFAALGALPLIENALAALPGYNINFMIIVQSIKQILKNYGKDHSFFDLCKIVCFSQTGDYDTAKLFSDMIGHGTIVKESVNNQLTVTRVGITGASQGFSEQGESLIRPEEIMKYPASEMIVLAQGMAPYRAKKVLFYDDYRFKKDAGKPYPETREMLLEEVPVGFRGAEWFHPPVWQFLDDESDITLLDEIGNILLDGDESEEEDFEDASKVKENRGEEPDSFENGIVL